MATFWYFAVAALLASTAAAPTSEDASDDFKINPEEYGEHFEGDMLFDDIDPRSGVRSAALRWPQRTVVYRIEGNFDQRQRHLLSQAMSEITHRTRCINFRVAGRGDRALVRISNSKSGCFSAVGRTGGVQDLNLAPACFNNGYGTAAHEMIHAIGFHHEQSRSDRDNFIRIDYGNVQPGKQGNFRKYATSEVNEFGVTYDYGSIMHYSRTAFSRNGRPTIVSQRAGADRNMGQRRGLSDLDVLKIRRMYNC